MFEPKRASFLIFSLLFTAFVVRSYFLADVFYRIQPVRNGKYSHDRLSVHCGYLTLRRIVVDRAWLDAGGQLDANCQRRFAWEEISVGRRDTTLESPLAGPLLSVPGIEANTGGDGIHSASGFKLTISLWFSLIILLPVMFRIVNNSLRAARLRQRGFVVAKSEDNQKGDDP